MPEIDEAAIRERWTPPKREDYVGDLAYSLAHMQWSLSRGSDARTDIPLLLAALDEARAEVDEMAGRLSVLLWELTGGLMSKPTYPVNVMVTAIEAEFEKYANDDLIEATARAQAAESALEAVRALIEPRRIRDAITGGETTVRRVHVRASDLRAALATPATNDEGDADE